MALKLRGNSQIKLGSVNLEQLQDISAGKILGRALNDNDATPTELSGESVRIIAGLHTTDSVEFSGITGTSGNFSSTLTVDGDVTLNQDLTVEGNLTVKGSTTALETTNLRIDDPIIQVGKSNTGDSADLGFFGAYNDGDDKWTGLVRDASDDKFKLFSTTEDLTSLTEVDFSIASKVTLVADIEGDIEFENDVTFTLSGDVSGSATFSGNDNPTISVTIQDDSVQLSNIDFFVDEDNMSSDSDVKVPSQQSVKAYVDSKVSSGGFSNLDSRQMQMAYNDGSSISFVNVEENIVYHSVTSSEASNGEISLSTASEDQFDDLSDVFLNGQKIRFGTSTDVDTNSTKEYYFDSSNSKIHFGSGILAEDDNLEIRYYTVV